jgi:transposase
VAAFTAFKGVPKVCLFDNMKTAVLERNGSAIRFHPELLDLAIRYIRDNFFAGRHYSSLEDLNAQADEWCSTASAGRPCPEDTQLTVAEAFLQEQSSLLALPDNPFETR